MFTIPEGVIKLWNSWNIRSVILFSLSLQTILILSAPLRKCTSNKKMIFLIWAAYLLADWAASFCVGLISDNQRNPKQSANHKNGKNKDEHSDLLAFWAPFLLLHLGGPDTITAFSLEDNALWLRHLTGLIFQAAATFYVFLQTLPTNELWIPTLLMFVNGIIKYAERTRSLFLASLDKFRDSMLKEPDPGPNYAKLMEEYASKKDAKLPTDIIMTPERVEAEIPATKQDTNIELNELQVLVNAYHYFQIFKGLLVDIIFSFKERKESRDFFRTLSASSALQVMEVELNFMYESLFTKVAVVHTSWGYLFRLISFGSLMASITVFRFHVKHKHGTYPEVDIRVTYTLLGGAICLDLMAFLMIIFSDWSIAYLFKHASNDSLQNIDSNWKKRLCNKFLQLKKKIPLYRRWSRNVSRYNLISYCLKSKPKRLAPKKNGWLMSKLIAFSRLKVISIVNSYWHRFTDWLMSLLTAFFRLKAISTVNIYWHRFTGWLMSPLIAFFNTVNSYWDRFIGWLMSLFIDFFGLKDFIDAWLYSLDESLEDDNLWKLIFDELKKKADNADDPETAMRICSARGEWALQHCDLDTSQKNHLLEYVNQVSYDESLVTWHIATELCYNHEEKTDIDHNIMAEIDKKRKYSKLLSDYMLYLLIVQPTMMSAVGGIGKIRFRDTCAEAERFFSRRDVKKDVEEACKKILEVNTDVKPINVKGDRSKSVLFDASRLAKLLNDLETKQRWDIIFNVWVELTSYAASHCRASSHGQLISKGGELVTFVWLLMAHFGIGEQFQINEGHARVKLMVGK